MSYVVKVVHSETGEVVKMIEAVSERHADRIEGGVSINLNHDQYHTEIEPPTPKGAA